MGMNIGVFIWVSRAGFLIGFDCKDLPGNWIGRLMGSSGGSWIC